MPVETETRDVGAQKEQGRAQHQVEGDDEKQPARRVASEKSRQVHQDQKGQAKACFDEQQGRKMLAQQLPVLRNMPRIEVLDAKIVDHLEQVAKAQQGGVIPPGLRAHVVLHAPVYPEDVKGLDQKVDPQ